MRAFDGWSRSVAVVGVLLAVAALPGCSKAKKAAESPPPVVSQTPVDASSPTPTPTVAQPKNLDPCALVSQQDAEALAGTPLEAAEPSGNTEDSRCTYTGPVSGPLAQVEIHIGPGAKKALDIDKETLGHAFVPVEDLGDEAHLEDFQVFFRKGTIWASIRLVRLEDPAGYAKPLEDLARELASRM